MWFTPLFTTEEMKKKTNNPNFEYEISCDQMCGRGHFTMRGVIKVVSPDEFILWRVKQKSNYATVFESEPATPPKTDSTMKAAATVIPEQDSRALAQKK
jgi:cytochrome c oxidase subunit 2